MKLYDGLGPNPQVVRMFLAELGVEMETVTVDIMSGENRQEGHLNKNPMGQLPTLELDDGTFLAEITAICEYLDDIKGGTNLIGTNPEERALTRMWTRRISLNICEAMTTAFRGAEGHDFFKDRLRTFPDSAEDFKAQAKENLALLDKQIEGKEFICGNNFTLADIMLFCFLHFGSTVGQDIEPKLKNINTWFEKVGKRSSASA
ncbi:MAG: glutathione S-transferase [Gammaproteobacteria bacterium]|nr:glutathione S-transferase [Gammaproteobacteria bacterium]MBI80894.1 glutathione S-transferase [Gammaproteobacteria bacterium]|tara:strand:+ start:10796 stop:11407 length:612 start_codon:yes stop_codon:yes gene_type:complete